jgi:uncharacterized protein
MELLNKLTDDMKLAMKSGQKDRLLVIRMLISEVKNIDLQPTKPTAQQAVEGYLKKLKKSLEEYEKIGRSVEVGKLKEEIAVVEEYLPRKLTAEATEPLVDAFLAGNSFTEKDAGRATGMFMKQHGQAVDAGVASTLLKAKLNGK